MRNQPEPPESLPKYIAEGVPKQDDSTLQELQVWIDELIEYRSDISASEVEVPEEETIETVDNSGAKTTVVKKIPCGKESCSTCPHGPYRYEVHRDGNSLVWEYKGVVE